ncbi:hypothetical protein Fmac_015243 [Flemingia macrophylla]|uniref:Uncharacterized protein n=1 Tax=Flemingia macrophylla TaxID=520843 RepID=A0ABD1ME09_9FABA
MTTTLVSVLHRINLEWMSLPRLMPQTPIADHRSSRDKAPDREDASQLLAQFSARNDAIVIKEVHDVATDTSVEARKLEGKLDALVSLVTQLATNHNPASVARQFRERNDGILIRGVHDVATDTSVEARKLEGKLDALVNLVTLLAANQKLAFVARMSILRPMLQTHTADHHSNRDKALDREDGSQLLAVQCKK